LSFEGRKGQKGVEGRTSVHARQSGSVVEKRDRGELPPYLQEGKKPRSTLKPGKGRWGEIKSAEEWAYTEGLMGERGHRSQVFPVETVQGTERKTLSSLKRGRGSVDYLRETNDFIGSGGKGWGPHKGTNPFIGGIRTHRKGRAYSIFPQEDGRHLTKEKRKKMGETYWKRKWFSQPPKQENMGGAKEGGVGKKSWKAGLLKKKSGKRVYARREEPPL